MRGASCTRAHDYFFFRGAQQQKFEKRLEKRRKEETKKQTKRRDQRREPRQEPEQNWYTGIQCDEGDQRPADSDTAVAQLK